MAVQPCIKWIPISKKCSICWETFWDILGSVWGMLRLHALRMVLIFLIKFCVTLLCITLLLGNCTKKIIAYVTFWWQLFSEFFGQYWILFLYLLGFVCFLRNFCTYFVNNTLEVTKLEKNKECWPFLWVMWKFFWEVVLGMSLCKILHRYSRQYFVSLQCAFGIFNHSILQGVWSSLKKLGDPF